MKTQIIENPVAIEAGESQEFTIKANGKAFRALISTLYENKEQSIVREIWSNALDAHIDAGIPERPFSVVFPDVYNPSFVVRDYGKSMGHADVMHLYSTIFESTKEESEDEAGKFGLGSKSPFAYTDTFSVVTFKDGVKRHYSAVIGKKGIPAIHFFGETTTDEEQGVEVSFPIKNDDIRTFRNAAKRVSHGFDVKPDVLPQSEDSATFEGWPTTDTVLEGSGWRILRGSIEGYGTQAYAKMGPVLYPINVNAIENLPTEARQLLQTAIIIDFSMGDIEMTPSREALSYGSGDPTANAVRTRSIEIVTEMLVEYQARYDGCNSYWNACCQYSEDMQMTTPSQIRTILSTTANWRGNRLVKELKVVNNQIGPDNYAALITGQKRHNKVLRFADAPKFDISTNHNTIVYVEDTDNDTRVSARIKYDLENRAKFPENIVWVKNRTENLRAKQPPKVDLMELFDGAEMVLVSDLVTPPKASGARGHAQKQPVALRSMSGSGELDVRLYLTPEQVETGGFYVPLERNEVLYPNHMQTPSRMLAALKQIGAVPIDTILYGVPKTLWKRFSGKQWVNIYDLGPTIFGKMNPKAAVAKRAMIDTVTGDALLRYLKEYIIPKNVVDGALFDALNYLNRVKKLTAPDITAYKGLARAVGQTGDLLEWAVVDTTELDKHKARVNECYPLIDTLRCHCTYEKNMVDKLAHYVQVCDKAAKADSSNKAAIAA